MAKPIMSPQDAAKKWAERGSASGAELVKRVKESTWKTEAVAGEDNFKTAMNEVIAKGLRKKGIEKASDAKWQGGIEKNQGRYEQGIRDSQPDMEAAMTVVIGDIKTAVSQLKARGPKGSASNYDRSKQLGTSLHDAATKRKSA